MLNARDQRVGFNGSGWLVLERVMTEWIAGFVLLGVSVTGSLWVERRRFYRRNPAGLQAFRSFGASLATGTFESVALLVFRLLGLAGVAGLILAAFKTFAG